MLNELFQQRHEDGHLTMAANSLTKNDSISALTKYLNPAQ